MNCKRIVFAVAVALAIPAAANADEETVTIYGHVGLGLESVSAKGASDKFAVSPSNPANVDTRTRVTDNGSYLGFKGTEDLGDGLSAMYQVESAIKPDDGCGYVGCQAQAVSAPASGSATFANRQSFIGLKSRTLGELRLGRLDMYFDKHVPTELQMLKSGYSSTALAVLGYAFNSAGAISSNAAQATQTGKFAVTQGATLAVPAILTTNGNTLSVGQATLVASTALATYLKTNDQTAAVTAAVTAGATAGGLVTPAQQGAAQAAAVTALRSGAAATLGAAAAAGSFYNVGNRASNVIQYKTPSFNGFTGLVAYQANEKKGMSGLVGRPLNPYAYEVAAAYFSGNIFSSLTYHVDKDPVPELLGGVISQAQGLKFSFGMSVTNDARLGFVVEQQKDQYDSSMGFGDNKRETYVLAGSYKFTPTIESFATFGLADNAKVHGVKQDNSGAKYYQLTALYNFSKRTNVFLTYARVQNDEAAAYNFFIDSAVTPGAAGQSPFGNTPRGSDPTSLQLGMSTTF